MTGIFMESIVMAFMIGAIVGAVTALHLSGALVSNRKKSDTPSYDNLEKAPLRVKSNNAHRR